MRWLVLVDKNRETWGEAGREKLLFVDEKIKTSGEVG
jgi:hypothetical protein